MASFQAKTGWKRPRMRENKNYRSVPFRSRREKEISKRIAKKFRKLKKNHYGFISRHNKLEKAEKERK